MTEITPTELYALVKSGKARNLIDVRTRLEFDEVHAAGATLVTLSEVSVASIKNACAAADEPVYLFCKGGGRARQARDKLVAAGFAAAVVVSGGTEAWAGVGLPVVRGPRSVISLERQVRIAAGSLVLIGSILSAALSPLFLLLTAFVGAGLIFAGVTNRCGMALCLANMPWNKPH